MKVPLFVAADYANISKEGKLNIMGIFQTITASQFPARHSAIFLVMTLVAELGEHEQTRDMTIKLMDADGKEILAVAAQVEVPQQADRQLPQVSAVLELRDIVIEKPGRYMLILLIDKDFKAELSLHVLQTE